MFAVFDMPRKMRRHVLSALACLALAACEPMDFGGLGQRINPGATVPVALLVPSGAGNPSDDFLARSLENAARLAAAELQGANIDLRVYPTGGDASTASARARQAVDDGAKIILGPVYAESANSVGVMVAPDNVNVLAFSNNPTIAGGNVFILGPTFRNTANRLMGYAAEQGRSNIVVVHSNDVSGQLGRSAIQSAAASSGAGVVSSIGYNQSQAEVTAAVPRIRDAVTDGAADAVFMTATPSGALPLFAALLPESGVSPEAVKFIGLTRWDIPSQTLQLRGLEGGWFALPDPVRSNAFFARYQAAFGAQPHPIAGLAFDGVAAIGALVAQGNSDALTRGALTQPAGFQGVSGVFRLRSDGTNERAIAVATIEAGQLSILDPAPQGFGGF